MIALLTVTEKNIFLLELRHSRTNELLFKKIFETGRYQTEYIERQCFKITIYDSSDKMVHTSYVECFSIDISN